jgi:hypothetical protein
VIRLSLHRFTSLTVTLALAVSAASVLVGTTSAEAKTRTAVLHAAASYAKAKKYKVGIAVYDTKTKTLYGSGSYKSTFASESVVKVMIATRLILQGRMHGSTATRAYKMITQSDDGIASSFYGGVGGDGLLPWIKKHYHVPDLGGPPHRSGWWGNTHITAGGLVKFYAKARADKRVGKWLLNAMHHAKKHGSDGTYQFFGLPSATKGAAIKQGWGIDYDDWAHSADFNTTGFVNNDRYAIAILARGPVRTYGTAIGNLLTQTAKRLLPGGSFPTPTPRLVHMSHRTGPIAGKQSVRLRGHDFTGATVVRFGSVRATGLKVLSSTSLTVVTPAHAAGTVSVRIVTDHGTSSVNAHYTYVKPPTLTGADPAAGPLTGGTKVTVTGTDLTGVTSVWFGSRKAASFKQGTPGALTAVAPRVTQEGAVQLKVQTLYGITPLTGAARFTYVAAPST